MTHLTEKQAAYVAARAQGMGQAQAAREAGYSTHTAKVTASRLEQRADIKAAIADARGEEPQEPERSIEFETAEAYLAAVVAGIERPDPIRVSAARALIAYQKPRQRRPLPVAVPPAQEARSDAAAGEREQREQWAQKVVAIRSKLGRKPEGA